MTSGGLRRVDVFMLLAAFGLPAFVAPDARAGEDGFPLAANAAFCEPGYAGPFVGCTPWEGVTVSFVAVDQEFAESCVTVAGERTAGCAVNVPFGSTIVASVDPSVVPAGYVLEGAASQEFTIPDGPPDGIFGGPAFVLLPAGDGPPAEDDEEGFPLPANTAYCEPGYLGPFVGCTPWEGVTVSYASADGSFAASCTTVAGERTAGCTVTVPFGSTIVASIDPAVVPAGYVLEGAATQEFAIPDGPPDGIFGGPVFVLFPAAEEEAPPPMATEAPVEPGGMPAGIYAGTCAQGDDLAPVVDLNGPRVPDGDAQGAAGALPVAAAFTEVDVAFAEILDGNHVVAVYAEDDPRTLLACGAIGGVVDANGALSIGMAPVDDSGVVGVAYLSPVAGGTSTGVSLFIVEDALGPGEPA